MHFIADARRFQQHQRGFFFKMMPLSLPITWGSCVMVKYLAVS